MEKNQLVLYKNLLNYEKVSALELMRNTNGGMSIPGYDISNILNDGVAEGYVERFEDVYKAYYSATKKCREFFENLEKEKQEQIALKEKQEQAKKKKVRIMTAAVVSVCSVALIIAILFNTVFIPNKNYTQAVTYMSQGEYDKAITSFTALGDFKDSKAKIDECNTIILNGQYDAAVAVMNEGKYEEAIALFEQLGDFKPEIQQHIATCQNGIIENQYQKAQEFYKAKNYEAAMESFLALGTYKDSVDKAKTAKNAYYKELWANVKKGSTVYFGTYEQNNNTSDGKEDIEWIVLAKENNKVLLLSKDLLDVMAFSKDKNTVTWEKSIIREWANSTFYDAAFSSQEKKSILTTSVATPKNPSYGTAGSPTTKDKIFLLSIQEAQTLLTQAQRCAVASAYTFTKLDSHLQKRYPNGECDWFLRSPGMSTSNIANVDTTGDIHGIKSGTNGNSTGANPTNGEYNGFRPAMWVTLN